MIGTQELILIFFVVILLFGANKLPELARSLGKASGEFKKAQIEAASEIRKLETPVHESKNVRQHIQKLASDLGISIEGKDEGMLIEEINACIKSRS